MSAHRIPCPQCKAMILEVTAKHNSGLCAPCKRNKDYEALQTERNYYRENPPKTKEDIDRIAPDNGIENMGLRMFLNSLLPLKLNPVKFTKKQFTQAIGSIVTENDSNNEEICGDFLGLCDPILAQSDSLIEGLKKLPRPYREVMAVYQLWGMTMSDGFESYLEGSCDKVDSEIELGLLLLDRTKLLGIAQRARIAYEANSTDHDFEGDFNIIYEELIEFEDKVLGPFLVSTLTQANQ